MILGIIILVGGSIGMGIIIALLIEYITNLITKRKCKQFEEKHPIYVCKYEEMLKAGAEASKYYCSDVLAVKNEYEKVKEELEMLPREQRNLMLEHLEGLRRVHYTGLLLYSAKGEKVKELREWLKAYEKEHGIKAVYYKGKKQKKMS